jgi:hypothetical protein
MEKHMGAFLSSENMEWKIVAGCGKYEIYTVNIMFFPVHVEALPQPSLAFPT